MGLQDPTQCPIAKAPAPVYDAVEAGTPLEAGRIYRMAGFPLSAVRFDPEAHGELVAPDGLEIQRANPAVGEFHTVVFELMPDGYATERWPDAVAAGTRVEEPIVRCPVCRSTFPASSIFPEEYPVMAKAGVPAE